MQITLPRKRVASGGLREDLSDIRSKIVKEKENDRQEKHQVGNITFRGEGKKNGGN